MSEVNNFFPSLRAVMGDWVYYPILMNAREIEYRIMRSKDIRENKNLDDYLQREITPNVKRIQDYIKNQESRFFNSIIVGVFDDTPQWYPLNLNSVDIVDEERREYLEESMGILELTGSEKLFAIDGQHRIEAIKRHLLENEEFNDQFSIILVQHVDSITGKRRTRKLFSDINKKAQKVSAGELAIIDEEDIENIIARKIYSNFDKIPETSIALSKTTVINDSRYFTSLLTVVAISKVFKKNLKINEEDELYNIVVSFFDFIFNLYPQIVASFSDSNLTSELRDNSKMIFMRHIGLEVLAEIYSDYYEREQLEILKTKLLQVDLRFTSNIFADNIYRGSEIVAKHKSSAIQSLKTALDNI